MLEVGYELEYFATKKGEVVVPCSRHFYNVLDAGRLLVEARSKPFPHPRLALTSLLMEIERLRTLAHQKQIKLWRGDERDISPTKIREAMQYKCSSMKYTPEAEEFMADVKLTHFDPRHYKAGLHVHFSDKYPASCGHFTPVNMPRYIKALDTAFASDIKRAGRHIGAYRMKTYGFEYRSLPATVSLTQLTTVLSKIWPN